MKLRRGVFGLRRVTCEATRYDMDAVHVVRQDNGRVRAEASTGYSLVAAWFTEPDDAAEGSRDIFVPAKLCEQIAALDYSLTTDAERRVALRPIDLTVAAGRVSVTVKQDNDSTCFAMPAVDGKFPKIADTWPNVKGALSIKIDARRLVPVLQAMAELITDENNKAIVTLTLGKDNHMLLLTAVANECHVAGVLCGLQPSDETVTMQFDPKAMHGKEASPVS